ncbi:MAG: hypothetical protein ABGW50_02025 [Thermococcus sp.]
MTSPLRKVSQIKLMAKDSQDLQYWLAARQAVECFLRSLAGLKQRPYCPKLQQVVDELASKVYRPDGDGYKCLLCGAAKKTKEALYNHLKRSHFSRLVLLALTVITYPDIASSLHLDFAITCISALARDFLRSAGISNMPSTLFAAVYSDLLEDIVFPYAPQKVTGIAYVLADACDLDDLSKLKDLKATELALEIARYIEDRESI